jgi:hypothetical protein
MKKIARKIAMFLVLVMIASSLNGCFTTWAATGEFPDISYAGGGPGGIGLLVLGILILPVDLVVAGVVLIAKAGIQAARNKRGKLMEGIDTFSVPIRSLPVAELDSFMQTFDSLPEAEIASYTETMNSFSEREISAIVEAINNLSEAEIVSSIKILNSMSEETLIATLNNLQYIQFRYND